MADTAAMRTRDVRDVILRDGGTLRLRAPTAADSDALVAFFAGLSADSLRLRFHGIPRPDAQLVAQYLSEHLHQA